LYFALSRHDFHSFEPRSAEVPNFSAAAWAARPLRAIVMHFSTSGRTSLAFSTVVMMRPFTFGGLGSNSASRSVRNSALAKLRSRAR
jgi:hypothetical protein